MTIVSIDIHNQASIETVSKLFNESYTDHPGPIDAMIDDYANKHNLKVISVTPINDGSGLTQILVVFRKL